MTDPVIAVTAGPRLDREGPGASLAGLGTLVRHVVRRDRIRLPVWIIGLVVIMAVSADQVRSLYGSPEAIAGYVTSVGGNPALEVFAGPGYGFDRPTVGAILVNETSLWMALGCALMSCVTVNRHTRVEEESERADLVRAGAIGRNAPITAALVVAIVADLIVAAGSAAVCVAVGFGAAGSIALAASIGGVGVVFACVAAVAAQVAPTGRGSLGSAAGSVGLAFVARGIGDVAVPALSWMTPFGWGIGIRAFAGERWWTLCALAAMGAAATFAAYALAARRDLGSGMVPQRPGPPGAAPWMTTPIGIVWRLQRGALVGWTVGVFATGLVYGSIADEIETMLADNPELADYLARLDGVSVTDAYLATAVSMLAVLCAGYAVSSALRVRIDEANGHAELVLSASVSRHTWTLSHLAVTVACSTWLVLCAGTGVGIAYAVVESDLTQIPRLVGAAAVTVPAVLVLVGVATTLFGWRPHATVAAWGAFAATVVVTIFGELLHLPGWVRDLSPFTHVPGVPAVGVEALPVGALAGVAVALMALGGWGFVRRDLAVA